MTTGPRHRHSLDAITLRFVEEKINVGYQQKWKALILEIEE
jgi:hypothetical protein